MPSVNTSNRSADSTRRPFTLYAAGGRVYVSNVRNKLIDLGSIESANDRVDYLLDGEGPAGKGFEDMSAALRDIAKRLSFLYLDGQFTAQADLRDSADTRLDGAEQLHFEIDELGPREPATDPDV